MPLLSFYYISERERPSLPPPIDHFPTDWLEMKYMLVEVMAKLERERGITEGIIVLYRHLPGRAVPTFSRPYNSTLTPYKREFEASFKVSYNPLSGGIEFADADFNFTLSYLREDFWWMERGIRWRIPSVIPRKHLAAFGSIKSLMMEPSGLRYVNYSGTPRDLYSFGKEGLTGPYLKSSEGIYTQMEKRLNLRKNEEVR
jgi:hypothetical protein